MGQLRRPGVVSQFDSPFFRGPFGPGSAGVGATVSTSPTIHSKSGHVSVRPAAWAGVSRVVVCRRHSCTRPCTAPRGAGVSPASC